ncbi:hypothetical protein FRX31_022478 [Thalictrum thalictroides]|uniref:Uncharacterized protein n=1 Tax=Thalictrum thalictroides TaxID=46969 RepID=A0A7J6VUQ0_THATH|nr:hypothetical protein FRX31_022478 [Thalictrum thalictroides]
MSDFIIFTVILFTAILPIYTQAKVFKAGEDSGSTTGFKYKTWAKDNKLWAGEKLSEQILIPNSARGVVVSKFQMLIAGLVTIGMVANA